MIEIVWKRERERERDRERMRGRSRRREKGREKERERFQFERYGRNENVIDDVIKLGGRKGGKKEETKKCRAMRTSR